jgi:hypothetical protein
MNLAERVPYLKNICGVAIDLSALPVPSHSTGSQLFYDSFLIQSQPKPVYYGKRSVRFSENTKQSRAGIFYETTVEIQFPNSDLNRSLRIEEMRKAQYVIVQLSGGGAILVGRNDWYQNAKPAFKMTSDEQITSVKYTAISMFSSGFLPQYNSGLLPHSIPVNLLNAE